MKLNGKQIGALRDVICEVFDVQNFGMFVQTQLNRPLGTTVAVGNSMPVVAFNFIDALNREERTIELIRSLREAFPNVKSVVDFCDPILGAPPAAGDSRSAVRSATQRFTAHFQDAQRQRQFQYLNAYKELHEVLHQLQNFHLQIAKAAANRQASGDDIPKDIVLALSGWRQTVERYAAETEFSSPDAQPPWISRFTAAVDDLTGNDPARATRSAERLASLPGRAQGILNAELVKCARRLQTNELVEHLRGIASVVGPGPTDRELAELRSAASRFQRLCEDLTDLIRRHDLCQRIDDALQEAVGLPEVTAARLAAWSEIDGWLGDLAAGAPGDFRVTRTHDASRAFANIASASEARPAFENFMALFADLFMNTDGALLRVTNQLPYSAMTLNELIQRV